MSSVFGYLSSTSFPKKDCIKALQTWNRSYGLLASDFKSGECFGLGSAIHHLSNEFPVGSPLLHNGSEYAVIDAVLFNRSVLAKKLGITKISEYSDEELLFTWIRTKGYESLKEVSGDFAGAVYSETDGSLILFRDHMGVRPLYYYVDEKFFAFSTDIRGLTAIPETDTELNEKAFFEKQMGYNELTCDRTEYEHIFCVKPAHFLKITPVENGLLLDPRCYWKLGSKKIRLNTVKDYEEELYRLISEAIDSRAKAVTGKKGIELSGGLDSGVISVVFNRLGHKACYYSWSLDPSILPLKEVDERLVIEDICRQEGISCTYSMGKRLYSEHTFEIGIKNHDVPFINTLDISEGAGWMQTQGVKAIFSGYGGDEGPSHRSKLYELWYNGEYFSYLKAVYRQTKGKNIRLFRMLKRSFSTLLQERKRYGKVYYIPEACAEYLNPDFKKRLSEGYTPRPLHFQFDPCTYILNGGSRLRYDITAVLGMEKGIQYFFPYADYKVVDFAVSIPRHLYNDGITNRLIYRNAFRHVIPKSLYEVDYKNMPSVAGSMKKAKENTGAEFDMKDVQNWIREKRDSYLAFLDADYWKQYLNWEMVLKIGEEEPFEMKHYWKAQETFPLLVQCAYLQNVGMNIKEDTREL